MIPNVVRASTLTSFTSPSLSLSFLFLFLFLFLSFVITIFRALLLLLKLLLSPQTCLWISPEGGDFPVAP